MSERDQSGRVRTTRTARPKPAANAASRNTTRVHKDPVSAPRQGRRVLPETSKNMEVELADDTVTTEKLCQFTLSMRESLHKELAMVALADGMTMRGLIMRALRDLGLDVRDDDLVDRRRK